MQDAKAIRLHRLKRKPRKNYFFLPVDHGFTMGPIDGIQSTSDLFPWVAHAPIDAIVAHKGTIQKIVRAKAMGNYSFILHINGMPNDAMFSDTKLPVSGVDQAVELGCDAVSLQLNFTAENHAANWQLLGAITDQANKVGMPVLLMINDKQQAKDQMDRQKSLIRLLRSCSELGVDIVKIAIPLEDYTAVIPAVSSDIDVVIAGGSGKNQEDMESEVQLALASGAAGVCIGRYVFSATNPLRAANGIDRALGTSVIKRTSLKTNLQSRSLAADVSGVQIARH